MPDTTFPPPVRADVIPRPPSLHTVGSIDDELEPNEAGRRQVSLLAGLLAIDAGIAFLVGAMLLPLGYLIAPQGDPGIGCP
jgi:hypothetical protein